MNRLVQAALWLYPRLLRLYPRPFRDTFAAEMTAVFDAALRDAAAAGARPLLALLGRELRDWPASLLREHLWQRNRRLPLPPAAALSGRGALAAALPYLLFLLPFLLNTPGLLFLFLGGGVLAAWLRGWPGWSASWLGFLVLMAQNWLPMPQGGDLPWNSVPRLLAALVAVALQAGWLAALYGVARRWPRHAALAFLPFLILPWAFAMEFASQALTVVFFSVVYLLLGLMAAVISLQRAAAGDVWLLYAGTLLTGLLLTLGGGDLAAGPAGLWRGLAPGVLQAMVPLLGILLLETVHAWARERGRAARRDARWLAGGVLLAWIALRTLDRLVGPSDLAAFQPSLVPLLAAAWLLGAGLTLRAGWRLRRAAVARRYPALATGLLLLLPLLYRPAYLAGVARSLTADRPALAAALRGAIPALQAVDTAAAAAGLVGLLLLPVTLAWLRRHTAAFPAAPAGGWLPPRRRQRQTRSPAASRRRRAARLLALAALLAAGLFLGFVFLPLQLRAEPYTQQLALGDVDGDGDLDAVLANTLRLLPTVENRLLLNDGRGRFSDSGQALSMGGTGVVLLDGDGDGALDVLVGGMMGGVLFRNRGNGRFLGRDLPTFEMPESGASAYTFQAGDLNGDGMADAFAAGCCGTGISLGNGQMRWVPPVNRVLFGGATGLADSGQALGRSGSAAVDLGDVDGDGDLDAFVGNSQNNGERVRSNAPDEVWLNDGRGGFRDSGQRLGGQQTTAVALGDVDGDGDLDVLVGSETADLLWLNDGRGQFSRGGELGRARPTLALFLRDLDGDGDLDGVTVHDTAWRFAWWRPVVIWWNDGGGQFNRGAQRLRLPPNAALAVGDVDGDGRPDLVVGALDGVTVWRNGGNGHFD